MTISIPIDLTIVTWMDVRILVYQEGGVSDGPIKIMILQSMNLLFNLLGQQSKVKYPMQI
jgi:hypothetical protein